MHIFIFVTLCKTVSIPARLEHFVFILELKIPDWRHIQSADPNRIQLEPITGKTSPLWHMLLTVATHLTPLVTVFPTHSHIL